MKKYYDIMVINVISLTIGVSLYFCFKESVEILGAVIATGISLSLGIRQYKTENDKIFKELFTEFNSKYDRKFNNELETIVENYRQNEDYKLTQEQGKLIIDYLNLCAEEYLWKTKDRIPDEVWKSWENGMIYYLNNPLINEIFIREKGQKDSYYGLYAKIEKRIKV
jgi:hypothetical protein